MKSLRFHRKVQKELEALDSFTRIEIAELLALVAMGQSLGLPVSRPMPDIAHGAHELRIGSKVGQFRVFYFVQLADAILVFHFLKKKTQKTPRSEIETAQRRLGDML